MALVAAAALVLGVAGSPDVDGVLDHFGAGGVRVVGVATCSTREAVKIARSLRVWLQPSTKLWTLNSHLHFGFYVDVDCDNGKKFLLEASSSGVMENVRTHWFVRSAATPPDQRLRLSVVSQVTWFWAGRTSHLFKAEQSGQLQYKEDSLTPVLDFGGRNLTAAFVITKLPMDHVEERLMDRKDKHLDTTSKLNFAIHGYLQQALNYSLRSMAVSTWGYLHNGTYGGLIETLQTGDAHVSGSSVIVTADRWDVLDYTGPTWRFRSYVAFRHPPSVSLRSALFAPLSRDVWEASAALGVGVVVALRAISWADAVDSSWGAVIVVAAAAVGLQGTTQNSSRLSWRLVLLLTLLFSLLLNLFYSAAVVGSLLVPPPKTIRTLRQLIDSPLAVGIEDIGYNKDYLEKSTDPLVREFFRKKIFPPARRKPAYYDILRGVELMRTTPFAFQSEAVTMYPLIQVSFSEKAKCALCEVVLVPHSMTQMAVPKGSPLREPISNTLRKVWERGLLNYQERLWHPQRPPCIDAGDVESIEFPAVAPAFLLLGVGAALALWLLLLERCSCISGITYKPKRRKPEIKHPLNFIE